MLVAVMLVAILILVVVVAGLIIENKVLRILRYVMAFYITSSIAMYAYMYNLGRKHSKRLELATDACNYGSNTCDFS